MIRLQDSLRNRAHPFTHHPGATQATAINPDTLMGKAKSAPDDLVVADVVAELRAAEQPGRRCKDIRRR